MREDQRELQRRLDAILRDGEELAPTLVGLPFAEAARIAAERGHRVQVGGHTLDQVYDRIVLYVDEAEVRTTARPGDVVTSAHAG